MKTLLLFAMAAALHGQTDISSAVVRGVWNAGSATRTAPFKIGTSPPGTCTVGDQFWDSDATAGSNLYSCTSSNVWTLQAGSGATSISGLSDLKLTKTSGTVLDLAAGKTVCGTTPYSIAAVTITWSAGASGDVFVGIDCADAAKIKVARGTTLTLTGSGFDQTDDISLAAFVASYPNIKLIASVPVSGSAFGTVVDYRNALPGGGIVANTGLTCDTDTNGLPRCGIDSTVVTIGSVNAQTGTTYTYLDSDYRKLVTHTNGSAIAGTLPNAADTGFDSGWWMDVQNRGAGTLTITPDTSTIDGAASLALTTNQGVRIYSDGTNYFTQRGIGGSSNSYFTERVVWADSVTFTASTTSYIGGPYGSGWPGPTSVDNNLSKGIWAVSGTVEAMYVHFYISGVESTGSETAAFTLRSNGSDTALVCNVEMKGTDAAVQSCTGSVAVTKGHKWNIKSVTPAWTTTPSGVRGFITLRIKADSTQ